MYFSLSQESNPSDRRQRVGFHKVERGVAGGTTVDSSGPQLSEQDSNPGHLKSRTLTT